MAEAKQLTAKANEVMEKLTEIKDESVRAAAAAQLPLAVKLVIHETTH